MQPPAILLLILTLASPALSQPSWLTACFLGCVSSSGDSCAQQDIECHCKNIATTWSRVAACLQSSCTAEEEEKTRNGLQSVCAAQGASVTLSSIAATKTATVNSTMSETSTPLTSSTTMATSTRSSASASSSTSAETDTPQPDSSRSSGSSTNIGAIVGGTVGGLAILALAGVAVFYILRRHPRAKPPKADDAAPQDADPPMYQYWNADVAPQELPGHGTSELGGGTAKLELGAGPGGEMAHELPEGGVPAEKGDEKKV